MKYSINNFTRKDSTNIKAIAILIMVYYHSVALSGISNVAVIGKFFERTGNICVSMFAFISAYGIAKKMEGMYKEHSKKRIAYKIILGRIRKLYFSYVPAFLFAAAGTLIFDLVHYVVRNERINTFTEVYGHGDKGILHALINALGLNHLIYGDYLYTLNQTWWYMSLALIIAIVTPIIVIIFEKRYLEIAMYIITIALMLLLKNEYLQYLSIIYVGIKVAEREKFATTNGKSLMILAIPIIVWLVYRGTVNGEWNTVVNCLATYPIIVFCLLIIGNRKSKILEILGKNSANIFYLHSFVYLYWKPMAKVIHKLKFGVLIWIGTVAVSLVLSAVLEIIKKSLLKIIFKEKGVAND